MLLQVMSGGFLQMHLMHQLFFGDRPRPKSKVKSPKVHLGEAANKQESCFIFKTCGEMLNSAIYIGIPAKSLISCSSTGEHLPMHSRLVPKRLEFPPQPP